MTGVEWQRIGDAQARGCWDDWLLRFPSASLYQTFAWGEHRRAFGWRPLRWIARTSRDGPPVAVAQALLRRRRPGLGLVWVPGGPVGDQPLWADGFAEAVRAEVATPLLYLRVYSPEPLERGGVEDLRRAGWRRPSHRLRSGLSMRLDLTPDESVLRKRLSSNWRRNLKRVDRYPTQIRVWPVSELRRDLAPLLDLYAFMEAYKRIPEQFGRKELEGILLHLGDRILMLRCEDSSGRLLAARGCAVAGGQAWDLFAAAGAEARRVYASYGLFWRLIRECRRRGVRSYELMGIDPAANPGVTNFKKGTGALPVTYLGEWEWARPALLRPLANRFLARRGRI